MNSNENIPIIGLGTWGLRGSEVAKAIRWAVEMGYAHIDTASYYRNENLIGTVCQKLFENGVVNRKDLWITSKIWPSDFGTPNAKKAFNKSLTKLGLEYLDLYLIHWPGSDRKKRIETWKVLELLYNEGLVKSIGVSNFNSHQLKEIMKFGNIIPAVNQIKFNPYSKSDNVVELCNQKYITIEAYSPLNQGYKLNDSIISQLASKYNKTNAQIILRWEIQSGMIIIPKSSQKDRLFENISIFDFELTSEDMKIMNEF